MESIDHVFTEVRFAPASTVELTNPYFERSKDDCPIISLLLGEEEGEKDCMFGVEFYLKEEQFKEENVVLQFCLDKSRARVIINTLKNHFEI